jgi:hypothetical protein
MKQVLVSAIIIAMMINLENGMANTSTPAIVRTHTAIQKGQHHPAKPKLKLRSMLVTSPVDPEDIVIDDDLVLGRNRNRIEIVDEQEEELSDYVKIRLTLARMKAMKAYSIASLSK